MREGNNSGLSKSVVTFTLFLARGLPAGLRAILIFLLAAKTTKQEFALIGTAFVVVETLRLMFDCGQDTISIKLLSRPGAMWIRSVFVATRIKLVTWTSGFLVNLLFLAVVVLPGQWLTAAAISLIGVSQLFWNLPFNVLQARGWLLERAGLIWLIAILLLVGVATIGTELPVSEAVRCYAILEYAGLCVFLIAAFLSMRNRHRNWISVSRLRRSQTVLYMRRGWQVCLGQLAALIYGKFDVMLVTTFASATSVANYLFAQRIFDLSGFLIGGASSVMYANMAKKAGSRSIVEWTAAAKRWGTLFILLGVCVGLGFFVIAPLLIGKWMASMHDAIGFLWLFGIIGMIVVSNQYLTALLNSIGGFAILYRINLLNLALILVIGSLSFYLYSVAGMLLAIAAVYVTSSLLQAKALARYAVNTRK